MRLCLDIWVALDWPKDGPMVHGRGYLIHFGQMPASNSSNSDFKALLNPLNLYRSRAPGQLISGKAAPCLEWLDRYHKYILRTP